jgi:hypothetical protein
MVPPDPNNASQKRGLHPRGSPSPSAHAERAPVKLPTSMALIDPQPLTRSLMADLLALPDYAIVARFAQVDDRDYGFEVRPVGRLGCPLVAAQSARYADFVSVNFGPGCMRRAIFLPHPASRNGAAARRARKALRVARPAPLAHPQIRRVPRCPSEPPPGWLILLVRGRDAHC